MLLTLARLELTGRRLEQSAAYAEECAELSRVLAERPPPRRLLPSMGTAAVGLVASWRAGIKTLESRSLNILAIDRTMQGRLREGIEIAREALAISRELPERAEALGIWVLGMGLCEIGEYEEGLKLCRRATGLTRKAQNAFLLWFDLDNLGRAYEALLDLEEACRIHEEALEPRGTGPRYVRISSIRLCAVAALSEDWEEAYAHALKAHEGRTSLTCWTASTSITRSRRCCEEETREGQRRDPPFRPKAPRLTSGNGLLTLFSSPERVRRRHRKGDRALRRQDASPEDRAT